MSLDLTSLRVFSCLHWGLGDVLERIPQRRRSLCVVLYQGHVTGRDIAGHDNLGHSLLAESARLLCCPLEAGRKVVSTPKVLGVVVSPARQAGKCFHASLGNVPKWGGFERWVQVFPELTYLFANDG